MYPKIERIVKQKGFHDDILFLQVKNHEIYSVYPRKARNEEPRTKETKRETCYFFISALNKNGQNFPIKR